jgi:hypothetical protein
MAGVVFLAAVPAVAAKKKKSGDDAAAAGGKNEGAAQSEDKERPRPIVDPEGGPAPEAPKPDAQGNVNFGGSSSKGAKGRITVKAPPGDKVKVYLEGRYFGVAPQTISKVPPGDYIVELIMPGGKRLTKPVSVVGDEEASIEVGAVSAAEAAKPEPPMSDVEAEKRWKTAKIVGIATVSMLVLGLVFGGWEYMVQKDYDKKITDGPPSPSMQTQYQQELDDLAAKGNRLALAANAAFILTGVGLAATIIIGYPAYKARKGGRREGPEGTNLSFMAGPGPTRGSGMAGLVWQF